jgi:hypothetical protein
MAHVITWEQLKNSTRVPLPEGDRIEVVESELESAHFELELSTGRGITLWKCVTLTGGEIINDVSKFWIARIELMDAFSGPVSFRADSGQLEGTTLFLGKGDESGKRPTTVYHILEFPNQKVRANLKWIED